MKYRALFCRPLHSTAFSLRFFAPLIAASRHLAPALVNVACRTSCTTRCIGFVMPGNWASPAIGEAADGVELTSQMALRVQGDVLGTIALARAGAGLAQTYQFAVARESRGESSSRSWRTNAARPAAFRCSIPAGSYIPAVKKLVAFLVVEARAAPTFADLI